MTYIEQIELTPRYSFSFISSSLLFFAGEVGKLGGGQREASGLGREGR